MRQGVKEEKQPTRWKFKNAMKSKPNRGDPVSTMKRVALAMVSPPDTWALKHHLICISVCVWHHYFSGSVSVRLLYFVIPFSALHPYCLSLTIGDISPPPHVSGSYSVFLVRLLLPFFGNKINQYSQNECPTLNPRGGYLHQEGVGLWGAMTAIGHLDQPAMAGQVRLIR